MRGGIPTLPQYIFMLWELVEHRNNCTFTPSILLFPINGKMTQIILFPVAISESLKVAWGPRKIGEPCSMYCVSCTKIYIQKKLCLCWEFHL